MGGEFASPVTSQAVALVTSQPAVVTSHPLMVTSSSSPPPPSSDLSHILEEAELVILDPSLPPPQATAKEAADPPEGALAAVNLDPLGEAAPLMLGSMGLTEQELMDQAPVSMDPLMTFNSIPVLDSTQVGS